MTYEMQDKNGDTIDLEEFNNTLENLEIPFDTEITERYTTISVTDPYKGTAHFHFSSDGGEYVELEIEYTGDEYEY